MWTWPWSRPVAKHPTPAEVEAACAFCGKVRADVRFTWRRLGDVLRQVGRLDEAREAWEKALAMAHPDTSIATDLRERIGGQEAELRP